MNPKEQYVIRVIGIVDNRGTEKNKESEGLHGGEGVEAALTGEG